MRKEFPDRRTIIIFTGGPGTGKSGTAERFLAYLNNDAIEKISYDAIKEKNWDRFGFDDAAQKDRLNWWCLEEFYLCIQKRMWEDRTILIEYPFYQRHKPKLKELIDASGYRAVTIYLYTDMHTMYARGAMRDHAGDRHPGHLLEQYHKETFIPQMLEDLPLIDPDYETFVSSIAHKDYDIALGLRIAVDVTDFANVNYEEIYRQIVDYETAF